MCLRLIHGRICVPQQGLGIGGVERIDRHADTRARKDLLPFEPKWRVQRRQQPFGHLRGLLRLAELAKQNRKLVPAQTGDDRVFRSELRPRDEVARSYAIPQSLGDLTEEFVTHAMAQAVV